VVGDGDALFRPRMNATLRPGTTPHSLRLPGKKTTLTGRSVVWNKAGIPEVGNVDTRQPEHFSRMTTHEKRMYARDQLLHMLEGGESVNRDQRGGHNFREYNGYYELIRRIKQSEMRKLHVFAGSSVFEHLHKRLHGVEDVCKNWLETGLSRAQETIEAERAREASERKRARELELMDPMRRMQFEYLEGDGTDEAEPQGQKQKRSSLAEQQQRRRDLSTPDFAFGVLNNKCTWNEKQARRNNRRLLRLVQELCAQSAVLSEQKGMTMKGWLNGYAQKHDELIHGLEVDLDQLDRDRFTRLEAKLRAINHDIDNFVKGEDPNHGHLEMTLRAMRLNADNSIYTEKEAAHRKNRWYFELATLLNLSDEPFFTQAEETFIEELKIAAESNGKLTSKVVLSVAQEVGFRDQRLRETESDAEAAQQEGRLLDLESKTLKLIVQCCLTAERIDEDSIEHGILYERVMKGLEGRAGLRVMATSLESGSHQNSFFVTNTATTCS